MSDFENEDEDLKNERTARRHSRENESIEGPKASWFLRAGTTFSAVLLNLALWLFILLTAIFAVSFSRPFYAANYHELQTARSIGISEDDLDLATELLLDYLEDKRADLELNVTLLAAGSGAAAGAQQGGKPVSMFNEREKSHMVDVKVLYQKALQWRRAALAAALFSALLLLFYARKAGRLRLRMVLLRGLVWAALGFALVMGAVALYAAVDFGRFWTSFHLLFFSNDLWILDPARDRLIMMVPGLFFQRLVWRILLGAFAALLIYLGLYLGLCRLLAARKREENER